MFKKIVNGCVRVVNRWLPDPFLFAVILTIVVFIAAMFATKLGPIDMIGAWGATTGFWSLLSFSMQMALVLVLGSAMASAAPCKKALRWIASLAHNNMQAIVITTFVSVICCWLNWGFGLIAGALLAKEIAKRVPTVDYPLLIASAYSGFVIWHAGLSGSIPLALNGGYVVADVTYTATTLETIFHPMNLIMVGVILVAMPFVNYAMHPDKDKAITVNPALLVDEDMEVGNIEDVIRQKGGRILESVRLFDVYRGEQVEEGKKSVAFNLVYRDRNKTLTDEEVSDVHENVLQTLKEKLNAVLRDM